MSEPVVSARDLSKTYRVYARPIDRLLEGLLRRPRHTPFEALRSIELEVPRGEGFGIIGENGAGKSTLLKILAGVTAPTSGEVDIRGTVASIIDEALSVGDGYFQKKFIVHLKSYVDGGPTLLICSHAMYYISAFCTRALWMREGRVESLGPTQQVVPRYQAYLDAKSESKGAQPEIIEASPSSPARIADVHLVTGSTYRHASRLELEISWSCEEPDMAFHLAVGLNRPDEVEVASFLSHRDGAGPWTGRAEHRVRLEIPSLPLVKKSFKLYVFLLAEDGSHIHDTKILKDAFTVEYNDYPFGIVAIPHRWGEVGESS